MNRKMLEAEMKRKKITKAQVYGALGISRATFYRKCRGRSEFTQNEIKRIAQLLGLDATVTIFFDNKVS